MKTASTKLLEPEFEALRGYCNDHNTSINEVIGSLVTGLLQGRIKPRPTRFDSRLPFCPKCGFLLSFNFRSSEWGCLRCGYYCYAEAPAWQESEPIKI